MPMEPAPPPTSHSRSPRRGGQGGEGEGADFTPGQLAVMLEQGVGEAGCEMVGDAAGDFDRDGVEGGDAGQGEAEGEGVADAFGGAAEGLEHGEAGGGEAGFAEQLGQGGGGCGPGG